MTRYDYWCPNGCGKSVCFRRINTNMDVSRRSIYACSRCKTEFICEPMSIKGKNFEEHILRKRVVIK